jgi:hypothetical protein
VPQRLLGLVLVALMSSLTPLAHASPPDQHWRGSLYDNADYDDVVLAVADGVASIELHPAHDSEIDEATVAVVFPTDERVHGAPRRSSNSPRAPPAPGPSFTPCESARAAQESVTSWEQGWGDIQRERR